MGRSIFHHWAHLLGVTSATFSLWATIWAFFYRKFFWDFVGGELGDQGLVAKTAVTKFFVKIVVELPLIQVLNLLLSIGTLAIELSPSVGFAVSFNVRAGLYLVSGLFAVDAGVFYLITALVYAIAAAKGEKLGGVGEKGSEQPRVQRV